MNNLWSQARVFSTARHVQHNVKLCITIYQVPSVMGKYVTMLLRPSYNRHCIVSANKTVYMLLKQSLNGYGNQMAKSLSLF